VAQRGDSIPSVARKNLRRTKYLTSAELAEAIRAAQSKSSGNLSEIRKQIVSPESRIAHCRESVPVARDSKFARFYLTE